MDTLHQASHRDGIDGYAQDTIHFPRKIIVDDGRAQTTSPSYLSIMSGEEKCPVGKAEHNRGGARRLNFVPALNVAVGD